MRGDPLVTPGGCLAGDSSGVLGGTGAGLGGVFTLETVLEALMEDALDVRPSAGDGLGPLEVLAVTERGVLGVEVRVGVDAMDVGVL